MKTAITRKMHFNAAHRLHNSEWSDDVNKEVFGKCNNVLYHGHNYELEVKVIGVVNPETGFLLDVKDLKRIVNEKVINRFDHKNLNLDVPDFKELIPTAENISIVIYNKLANRLDSKFDIKIKLYETERNSVIYPA